MSDQPADPADRRDAAVPTSGVLDAPSHGASRGRRVLWVVVALAIVAAIVLVLAPLASPDPDGLESVAGRQGWLQAAESALYNVFPDYTIPGLQGAAGTVVAGLVGVAIVFLAMVGLGWALRRRKAPGGRSR